MRLNLRDVSESSLTALPHRVIHSTTGREQQRRWLHRRALLTNISKNNRHSSLVPLPPTESPELAWEHNAETLQLLLV